MSTLHHESDHAVIGSPEVAVDDGVTPSQEGSISGEDTPWNAYNRYQATSDVAHLATAIKLFQQAIDASSEPDAILLGWLGECLHAQYETNCDLDVLDQAILAEQRALALVPDGHPDRALRLDWLAKSLRVRFEHHHQLDDLESAISMQKRVVELTPKGHPELPVLLNSLSYSHEIRYERLGDLDDLERAIEGRQRADELISDDHPEKTATLDGLGYLLCRRFVYLGKLEDLEGAISMQQRALDLLPKGDPGLPETLDNLASSHHIRYDRLGNLDDLDRAIAEREQVNELTPDDHPRKPIHLNNLGASLVTRFQRLGRLDDLERAVSIQKRVVEITPERHYELPARLEHLANSQNLRYQRLGNLDDLEQAIEARQRANELILDDHPAKALMLNNLGVSLHSRFGRLGNIEDVETSISVLQRAIELTPTEDHPDLPARVGNLAYSRTLRYEHLGDPDDLERVIEGRRRADELTPDDHPAKALMLNNRGQSLRLRFDRFDQRADLESATSLQRRAVELTPNGHPDKPLRLMNLGQYLALYLKFQQSTQKEDFQAALSCFLEATAQPLGSPSHRLRAAQSAVRLLDEYPGLGTSEDLLLVHSRILDILPELVWLGHSVTRRLEESQRIGSLVSAAVCTAIEAAALEQALEWFEAGRGFMWTQVLSLRSPLDELERRFPERARILKDIHAKLQATVHSPDRPPSRLPSRNPNTLTNKSPADIHRELVIQYEKLLSDIRRQPGFEDFMRSRKLLKLLPSTAPLRRPIVFINVDHGRCDAVLILPDRTVTSVSLAHLSLDRAEKLRLNWLSYLRQNNVRERALSPRYDPARGDESIIRMLAFVWKWITLPVLQALGYSSRLDEKHLPHIIWCPTGPLAQIPLHAAGTYGEESGARVYDFVISSYTPSLSALSRSIEAYTTEAIPKVLVVTQPDTPGLSKLPGTTAEGKRLQSILLKHQIETSRLDGEYASVEAVRSVLAQHAWLHLACHGSQDNSDPMKSAFALYNGRLSLTDLMAITADETELAFLSACQTAVGDEKIPEESMHLAAGMLAVGYRGVIATMWSIRDDDAPVIVEEYYTKLLELRVSGTLRAGETGAAYALHEATKRLRKEVGEKEFVRWAPFVHFGA